MEKITQSLHYLVFDSADELPAADKELFDQAKQAVAGSYAPYSKYHVGAAVRLANGIIIQGSNQENISFPAGLCAERVAVFAAKAGYPDISVTAVAITAKSEDFEVNNPVPPCGMCRQAILEYEINSGIPIRVILGGNSGKIVVIDGMSQLLPLAFLEKGLIRKD